jgi:hypothetical protein
MSDFNEMFNLDANDFKEVKNDSLIYKISPKAGKNGVYSSLVRFIPWWKNPKKSLVEKWEAWLENPVTKKGVTVDCPSSIGKQSELMDIYWKLKNSPNPTVQDKAKYFSRKRKFWAIVQILKDENNPALEGKLMIMKFGPKIYDKIQAELKPEYGTPHVPFHPFEGKPFHIKCKEVATFPNYDESKFLDKPTPIMIDGNLVQPGEEAKLMKFLEENSPNLDDFGFREWSPEQTQHFREMVKIIVPTTPNNAENLQKGTPVQETVVEKAAAPHFDLEEETPAPKVDEVPPTKMGYDFNLD